MKFKSITAIALCAMAFISCDEDTANIGTSLTNENDRLTVTTQSFNVLTQSVAVDSVFTRERRGYFGQVKDPETNT
jgi:PBP1b-binding outer membrane lipoprotein LpoB